MDEEVTWDEIADYVPGEVRLGHDRLWDLKQFRGMPGIPQDDQSALLWAAAFRRLGFEHEASLIDETVASYNRWIAYQGQGLDEGSQ